MLAAPGRSKGCSSGAVSRCRQYWRHIVAPSEGNGGEPQQGQVWADRGLRKGVWGRRGQRVQPCWHL